MANYQSLTEIANRHNFDATETVEFDQDLTNFIIVTPGTNHKIAVTKVTVATEGAGSAGQYVTLKIYVDGSQNTIAKFFPTTTPGVYTTGDIYFLGDVNEDVTCTSNLGADKNFAVSVNYKII